jgi:hypothetical protein
MNAWKLTGGFPPGGTIAPGGPGIEDEFGGFLADTGLSGRGGGAIIAARGSLDSAAAGVAGAVAGLLTAIGGGAIGLAFSAGSSPGNTHTFLSAS